MIVSFQHQFIFVAIPKTATHAVREVLRPELGPHDWEQCTLFVHKRFPVEELARRKHGHLSCQAVQPFLIHGMWDRFFKFCVVRNPYDRFVSYCYFFNRRNSTMQRDPLGTMKQTIQDPEVSRGHGFWPQSRYVTDEDGNLMVDFIGRYERLPAELAQVGQRLDLQLAPLEVVNASKRKPYTESYDRELQEMVMAFYATDFALFGYTTEMEN